MSFWTYMLRCSDDSFYVGHTDNLQIRIAQHCHGTIRRCFTLNRRPVNLVFSQEFVTREEALAMELKLKGWSRAKKEALVQGNWKESSRLARSKPGRVPD